MIREAAGELGVDPNLDCLIAEDDDRIVGVVVFNPCDRRGFGVIVSIGVVQDMQRNGIATDLKGQAMNNCSAAGATKTISSVHRRNYKMQGVNDKLGIQSIEDPADGKYMLYTAELVPEEDDEEG